MQPADLGTVPLKQHRNPKPLPQKSFDAPHFIRQSGSHRGGHFAAERRIWRAGSGPNNIEGVSQNRY